MEQVTVDKGWMPRLTQPQSLRSWITVVTRQIFFINGSEKLYGKGNFLSLMFHLSKLYNLKWNIWRLVYFSLDLLLRPCSRQVPVIKFDLLNTTRLADFNFT